MKLSTKERNILQQIIRLDIISLLGKDGYYKNTSWFIYLKAKEPLKHKV